ncbi:hypothetical protein [Elioraea sp.]|uniref:hypothetical protein n=1 Tax=Elioraea sp. TaxID=2185103 RepID=UPI0025C03411|nr:hypothetical protein [Elioraea sp.]
MPVGIRPEDVAASSSTNDPEVIIDAVAQMGSEQAVVARAGGACRRCCEAAGR